MRGSKPSMGNNAALVKRYYGRFPMNGAAAPAAWTQGGQGMGIPTYPAAGTFQIVLTDPPGGVLLDWKIQSRADTIGNNMCTFGGTWVASTNTFKFFCSAPTAPQTAADPPAAATDREFSVLLVFSQSENH